MRRFTLFLVVLLVPSAIMAADCDKTAPRASELSAGGITIVSIDAAAGSLDVTGRVGATAVRAHGEACASTTSLLDGIRLTTVKKGAMAVITVEVPDNIGWSNNHVARLNLTVELPAGINVRIDDSSGDIRVSDVGDLDVEDGSGSLRASNVRGTVKIDDGSGDIRIEKVSGDVDIDDGSGSIAVFDVEGGVEIDDSSGGIQVRGVRRDVIVDDSSGGIQVENVGGNFVVRSDGSGGVQFTDVRGRVDVPRKRD